MKKICRINNGKMEEGVCGGIAKYFGIDVSVVRFVWLLLCLAGGIGIWLYLICTLASIWQSIDYVSIDCFD